MNNRINIWPYIKRLLLFDWFFLKLTPFLCALVHIVFQLMLCSFIIFNVTFFLVIEEKRLLLWLLLDEFKEPNKLFLKKSWI